MLKIGQREAFQKGFLENYSMEEYHKCKKFLYGYDSYTCKKQIWYKIDCFDYNNTNFNNFIQKWKSW